MCKPTLWICCWSPFTRQRVLHVQNNAIQHYHDPFTTLVNLEELWADDNQISEITTSFDAFRKLRLFCAGLNHLFKLPESLFQCTALTALRLDYNLLSRMSPSIGMLSALQSSAAVRPRVNRNTYLLSGLTLLNLAPQPPLL